MNALITAVLVTAALASAGCDRPKTAYNNSGASAAGGPTTTTATATSEAASPNAATTTTTVIGTASPEAAVASVTANVVADTVTTGKVKAAIAADSGMKDTDVSVSTTGGVVTLTGTVKSQDQVSIATNLAQRQEGVSRVDTSVAIK